MDNSIQLFNYDEAPVRVIMRGAPPAPWWVAKDVCDILGYANVTDTLNKHLDEDERNTLAISEGKRGNPNMNVINESGLYCLILRSNMPKAKEFRKWVTATVLPQVMRIGLPEAPIKEEPTQYQIDQLNLERAKLLQHIIDAPAFPLSDESKAVIQHEAFKILTGHECLTMLPVLTEQWYSAADIGKELGITGCKVGHIANKYHLKPPKGESNKYGRWIRSKAKHNETEVPQFVYSQAGMDWFMSYNDGLIREA
jgi:prophage antirepressor-like protein